MKNKKTRPHPLAFIFACLIGSLQSTFVNAQEKTTVDLLIAYTSSASRIAGNDSVMVGQIQKAVEDMNEAFANSVINNHQVRLLRTVEIEDYPEPSCFAVMLRDLSGNQALGKTISTLRRTYHADLVALIVKNDTLCGLPFRDDTVALAGRSFCVVNYNCMLSSYSLSHMLGHLYGCGHAIDPANKPADGVAFPYAHGFGVEYEECYDDEEGEEEEEAGKSFNTIMSITDDVNCYQQTSSGCFLVNHFSNPEVSYLGVPTGNEYANNARVIKEQAPVLAGFYPLPESCSIADTVSGYDLACGMASGNLSTGTAYTANSQAKVFFTAGSRIELNAGFAIGQGCYFESALGPEAKSYPQDEPANE